MINGMIVGLVAHHARRRLHATVTAQWLVGLVCGVVAWVSLNKIGTTALLAESRRYVRRACTPTVLPASSADSWSASFP